MTETLINPTDAASISRSMVGRPIDGDVTREGITFQNRGQWQQEAVFEGEFLIHHGFTISINQFISISPITMTQAEKEFSEQKEAFLAIPPLLLAEYRGEYVVSHNGEILDHDTDLPTLTRRFYEQHGDIAIYIDKVNGLITATIDTPFLD